MNRERVSAARLQELWMQPDAVGLVNDLQAGVRIIVMLDGTEYETPLRELRAEPVVSPDLPRRDGPGCCDDTCTEAHP